MLSEIGEFVGDRGIRKLSSVSKLYKWSPDDPLILDRQRFQPLRSIVEEKLQLKGYPTLESIRCVPYVYVDVKEEESIDALSKMHKVRDQLIFRGLTETGKHPFLSFNFWNALSSTKSLHVLFVFEDSSSAKVSMVRYKQSWITGFPFDKLGPAVRAKDQIPSDETLEPWNLEKVNQIVDGFTIGNELWLLQHLYYERYCCPCLIGSGSVVILLCITVLIKLWVFGF